MDLTLPTTTTADVAQPQVRITIGQQPVRTPVEATRKEPTKRCYQVRQDGHLQSKNILIVASVCATVRIKMGTGRGISNNLVDRCNILGGNRKILEAGTGIINRVAKMDMTCDMEVRC